MPCFFPRISLYTLAVNFCSASLYEILYIYLLTLYKPSLDSKTLFSSTTFQHLPSSRSCSQSCSPSTYPPHPFDPVVRHRRYTNAPASYACIQHLSTPLSNRHANGCLLPPYGSHLPCYMIRFFV